MYEKSATQINDQMNKDQITKRKQSSQQVTTDVVGDFYWTSAIARSAVKSGISQQEFILLLLKEVHDTQELLIKVLSERPPSFSIDMNTFKERADADRLDKALRYATMIQSTTEEVPFV
jgi:hypothetical protein